ncbi:hypothetical protein Q672_19000 [Marinobacter sp. EVN1]|nr:hypothetical protein Q672_19000 [Marinobacter sp. EVN1]
MMTSNCLTALEPLYPNCQTPPSLFSIWSGLQSEEHGILGYETPDTDVFSTFHNSFTAWPSHIDMVWDKYARVGYRVRLHHVPFVDEAKLARQMVARSDVYSQRLWSSQTVPLTEVLNIDPFSVSIAFSLINEHRTKLLMESPNGKVCHLVSNNEVVDLPLPDGELLPHLSVLISNNGQEWVCSVLGKNAYRASPTDNIVKDRHQLTFCHEALTQSYRNGLLGDKLVQGGGGEAEEALLLSLEKVHRCFLEELALGFSQDDADLYVGYYPVFDLALHELLGLQALVSSTSQGKKIMTQLLLWVEEVVHTLTKSLDEGEVLVMNSDHGMQPIQNTCYLNNFMAEKGWLRFKEGGEIDWSNTVAAYHPAENGTLSILADKSDTETIIADILDWFEALGFSGAKVVRLDNHQGVLSQENRYFLIPPDGLRVKASQSVDALCPSAKSGDHCAHSDHPWLKGVFMTSGLPTVERPQHLHQILKFIEEG